MNAFITVEDTAGLDDLEGVADKVLEEFPNLDIELKDHATFYFVLKVLYDEYEELQELIGTISYILIGEEIMRYTITLNCD